MTHEEFGMLVGAVLDGKENKVESVLIEEIQPCDAIIGSIRFGSRVRLFRLFEFMKPQIIDNNTPVFATFRDTQTPIHNAQLEYEKAVEELTRKWRKHLHPEVYEYLKHAIRIELGTNVTHEPEYDENAREKVLTSLLKVPPAQYEYLHRVLRPDTQTIQRLVAAAQSKVHPKKILH